MKLRGSACAHSDKLYTKCSILSHFFSPAGATRWLLHALGVEDTLLLLQTTATTTTKQQTMGRALRSGNQTEFDPSLLGRAGRLAKSDKVDVAVSTRARAEAAQHQADRRQQARGKIPDAPCTPDKSTLLLREERGGRASRGTKPTCLHFGVEKDVQEYLYPNNFFVRIATTTLSP